MIEAMFFSTKKKVYELPAPIGTAYGGGYIAGMIRSDYDGHVYMLILSGRDGSSGYRSGAKFSLLNTTGRLAEENGTPPRTLSDGFQNHKLMKDSYLEFCPAVSWVESNINSGAGLGGYKDWYIPARDELELVYRNFKPDTRDNNTDLRSSSDAFGADGRGSGVNDLSIPAGSAYTQNDPSQTEFINFQKNKTDSLVLSTSLSSTEASYSQCWTIYLTDGNQMLSDKQDEHFLRVVRRIKL